MSFNPLKVTEKERERESQENSRRVKRKENILGRSETRFISGEKENLVVIRFPGSAHSST
jgi:hypothetical protein